MEADLVKREGVPFAAIPAAGVHGVGMRALPGNLWRLGRGFLASRRILAQFRPDVLFFTGGYVAAPMALAARLPFRRMRRPRSLVYVPDIEPGLALQTLLRFADHIAVTTPATKAFLPKNKPVTVTGYPVRLDLNKWSKEAALQKLGLSPDLPVLLVSGGSKGARSLNRALLRILPELLYEWQLVHISGRLDWQDVENARRTLTDEQKARYLAYPYLYEEMGAALTAADLALMRAGASTLGELPFFGLPAILVPYPYAWRYQHTNAVYLAEHGGAVVLEDSELPAKLLNVVRDLRRDPDRLVQMGRAMSTMAQPEASHSIAAILDRLAQAERPEKWSA